jgi:hypothetical protein
VSVRVGEALDEGVDAPLRVVGRALGRAVEVDVELDLEAADVLFEPRQLLLDRRLLVAQHDLLCVHTHITLASAARELVFANRHSL